MMTKLGIAPNISVGQDSVPTSLQSGMSTVSEPSSQNPLGSIKQLATKLPDQTSQGMHGYGNIGLNSSYESFTSKSSPIDTSFGTRTEKVLSNFLQNPILKGDGTDPNEMVSTIQYF